MFSQYFGQYLLNQNLLSGDQLRDAMDSQKDTRVKLGVLAINQGYMTANQVESVHQQQMRVDKRFGELAVEMGYIRESQVEELLTSQKSDHLLLGQTLIDRGILTYETFSELLQRYKKDYELTDEQFSSILKGNMDFLISAIMFKDGAERNQWLTDYVGLFAKNLVRFIDGNIRLELAEPTSQVSTYDWIFTQEIYKDHAKPKVTAIAGSEQALIRFAARFAQEEIEAPDEIMQASIGEFLNLHNGIFLVNMSNYGHELAMKPQGMLQNSDIHTVMQGTVVRVYGSDIQFDLWIADLSELFG